MQQVYWIWAFVSSPGFISFFMLFVDGWWIDLAIALFDRMKMLFKGKERLYHYNITNVYLGNYRWLTIYINNIASSFEIQNGIKIKRSFKDNMPRFLDFCKFESLDVEQKAIKFCRFAKSKSQEEVEDLVIRFVLFQKKRIDEGDITSGTLRNHVRAVKLFCRMNRITIFWDIISHSLPKIIMKKLVWGRQFAQ